MSVYLVNTCDNGVNDLTLVGLEDNGLVLDHKLGESASGQDFSRADVGDGQNADNEANFARAGALDVAVQVPEKEFLHVGSIVGRVQVDCM